jgi:predicted DsbA family dithiol-disulfide isomerase
VQELLVFTDYICPWCYLGRARVRPLTERFALRARHVHFPLHPGVPAEGIALSALFAGRPIDLQSSWQRLGAALGAEGLPFAPHDRTYRTREAQELAAWADGVGGPSLHDHLFHAVFAEGQNIGDPDVLVEIAARAGHSRAAATAALASKAGAAQVEADHALARQIGVRSVPTFVIGRHGVAGAQPLEVLESLARQAGVAARDDGATTHP